VAINNGTVTTRSADDGVNASLDDGLADQNATPSIIGLPGLLLKGVSHPNPT